MKNEVEVFKVEIVRDRDTGTRRVRVWALVEVYDDGQTSRIVADEPLDDPVIREGRAA